MQCPACRVSFHDRDADWESLRKQDTRYPMYHLAFLTLCPECHTPIVELAKLQPGSRIFDRKRIYPIATRQIHVDPVVPELLRNDYVEAIGVLDISPKASAALSRRILQSVLKEQGYVSRDLSKQVDAVLNESDSSRLLPLYVRSQVDAIRNFGNFSAHQQMNKITSEIIDVEPEEAEWCLEIVSALFEHYYARLAAEANRLADLNEKLQQAGKPPVK